jgi:thiamine biosynthesis protein ThiI
MNTEKHNVICRYGEIALKGGNRRMFEQKLIDDIRNKIGKENIEKLGRISGRIFLSTINLNKEEIEKILKKVLGLEAFSFVFKIEADFEKIKEKTLEILREKEFNSFRVTASRSQKNFPLNSQEINVELGAYIVEKLNKKVNLHTPDITCFVEIVEKTAYLSFNKIIGTPGLPFGIEGKAISLMSGGIDSPVASYYAMKRGVEVIFVHFHSYPYTNKASIEKVKDLVKLLSGYQGKSKLFLIPFAEIQEIFSMKTNEKLRVVLYRRFMLRVAEEIANQVGAKAIISGDSLGQVASQTLDNMAAISQATEMNIIRPLVCFNKNEIMAVAREIGSYEISIKPHDDACSRFVPVHPETKARLKDVLKEEKKLKLKKLIKQALDKIEIINIHAN